MAKRKTRRRAKRLHGLGGLAELAGLKIPIRIGKVHGECRLTRTRSRWKRMALRFVCKRVRRKKAA